MNNNFHRNTTHVAPYYRVLFQNDEHMVNNWNQGRFVSYHYDRHPSWNDIWNQNHSVNPLDYPLEFAAALYNWRARVDYLQAAQLHNGLNNWSRDEERAVRLAVGVSAFRCPGATSRYSATSDDHALIATFSGIYVCRLAELEHGGVQAIVVEPIAGLLTPAEFRKLHEIRDPEPQANPAGGLEYDEPDEHQGISPDMRHL